MSTWAALVLMVAYYWTGAVVARKIYTKVFEYEDDKFTAFLAALGAFVFWPFFLVGQLAINWLHGPTNKIEKERQDLEDQIQFWDKASFDTDRSTEDRSLARQISKELREKRDK